MRHRRNKLIERSTGNQKRSLVMRNLLTSLVKNGRLMTTSKRAKALVSEADSFFATLIGMLEQYASEADAKRECIRLIKSTIFTESEGKKITQDLIPKYKSEGKKSGFVASYKLGYRMGDGSEKVLVTLL